MWMLYDQLVADYGAVTYEAFINLLVRSPVYLSCSPADTSFSNVQVDITEDQTSPAQLRESFRGIAADKVGHNHPVFGVSVLMRV